MSISFAVTAYNEMSEGRLHGERILACIRAAEEDKRIDEIVVVDDGSSDYPELMHLLGMLKCPKFHLYGVKENLGVFGNKIEAVALCNCDWVITCDSDNSMGKGFFDAVLKMRKHPTESLRSDSSFPTINIWASPPGFADTWYCPSFAKTHFDYRELIGEYDLANIHTMFETPIGNCAINTGNQTVHRESFMEVFGKYRGQRADLMLPNWLGLSEEQRKEKYWRLVFDACDSLILNMLWLYAGKKLQVTEGMEYDHYYASGPEGNYTRSPVEKGKLGEILLEELKARSQHNHGKRN